MTLPSFSIFIHEFTKLTLLEELVSSTSVKQIFVRSILSPPLNGRVNESLPIIVISVGYYKWTYLSFKDQVFRTEVLSPTLRISALNEATWLSLPRVTQP